MLKKRVIPCLLISKGGLVKTIRFKKPKYVGDPVNAIRIFNEKEVDELIVLDIDATRDKRGPDFKLIEKIAEECFMPLSYGGGINKLEHAKLLFKLGVEKICIQSAVFQSTRLLSEISQCYGNQSVIVSVDLYRNHFGKHKIYRYNSNKIYNSSVVDFLNIIIKAGAGEVMINYVNKDGTRTGMEYESISTLSKLLTIPLIAIGGAGSLVDIKKAFIAGANAVGVGSLFVFHGPHKAVLITYPQYSTLEKLMEDLD